MNITIIYPHKRKTKSSTYGIAQMVLDRLLSGGTLHEFYLPQDMPHVCAGCYACMNGREDKCGGREYMQKLIAAIDDSELIIFCAPTYVYHIPGQVKTLLDHFAYRWLVHRPDLSLMCKQALIITTAAGGGMKSTVRDLRDSMNYWGVGRTHVITQAVWGYDWSSMPENFMHKIEQKVEKTVSAIQKSAEGYLLNIKGLEQDIEELKDRQSSEHSLREVNDPGIQVIDTYYYQVEGVRMKERLLIFAADYQHLDQTGKLFYLHKDKYKANCCILKKYDSILHAKVPRNKIYTLKKGLRSIYINNYEYLLMCYEDCPPPPPEPEPEDFGAKYKSVAEALDRVEKDWSGLLDAETEYYEKHLFLSERQRASMRRMLRHQKNTIDRYKNDLNEMADAYRKENQEYKIERSEDDLFSGTER